MGWHAAAMRLLSLIAPRAEMLIFPMLSVNTVSILLLSL
jgi:hypothetical protein